MKMIIAGGGTGGHIFPGIAVANAVKERVDNVRILFIGTKKGMENELVPKAGYPLFLLRAGGIKGKSLLLKLRQLATMPLSFIDGFRILHSYEPEVILGTGGYSAFAVCLLAKLLRIPMVIQEQNSVPGLTNRLLGKFANRIFLSFPESQAYFPRNKIELCGNPMRKAILEVAPLKDVPKTEPLRILILGGSRGARRLNEGVVAALEQLKDLREALEFTHQTGEADHSKVEAGYQEAGFKARTAAFFDDMAELYHWTHLVICRAGAGILEVAACGRPTILVPYPYATDNHQQKNAKSLCDQGAAIMIDNQDFTGEKCAEWIRALNQNRDQLIKMAAAALRSSRRDGAATIAESCIDLVPEAAIHKRRRLA